MKKLYDFDEVIDRKGTDSYKWDGADRYFGTNDVIPLWIADMDFSPPKEVISALEKRVSHNIYGYAAVSDKHHEPFIEWAKRRYGYDIDKSWILNTPGVVPGIATAILSLTKEGDEIIIQPPVYPPFASTVKNNNRKLVENSLVERNGRFEIDFEDLEKKAKSKNARMLVLCNPHNPVGRVWDREELQRLIDICVENNILIFSDEIHGDLIYKGNKFNSLITFPKDYHSNIIVATAPSKTFNIPGLFYSYLVIPNKDIKESITTTLGGLGIGGNNMNILSIEGAYAAYKYGETWLEELLVYLEANVDYTIEFINSKMKNVKVYKPEGTYLIWLDFREVFNDPKEIKEFLVKEAKVGLNDGSTFGKIGEGFARINITSPKSVIKEALDRIDKALKVRNI